MRGVQAPSHPSDTAPPQQASHNMVTSANTLAGRVDNLVGRLDVLAGHQGGRMDDLAWRIDILEGRVGRIERLVIQNPPAPRSAVEHVRGSSDEMHGGWISAILRDAAMISVLAACTTYIANSMYRL